MQRVSFLRLTAESSSVLDEEEAMCRETATHKSYYNTALRGRGAPPFPLRRLHPRRVQKTNI